MFDQKKKKIQEFFIYLFIFIVNQTLLRIALFLSLVEGGSKDREAISWCYIVQSFFFFFDKNDLAKLFFSFSQTTVVQELSREPTILQCCKAENGRAIW